MFAPTQFEELMGSFRERRPDQLLVLLQAAVDGEHPVV
jgi:hypothetical protein